MLDQAQVALEQRIQQQGIGVIGPAMVKRDKVVGGQVPAQLDEQARQQIQLFRHRDHFVLGKVVQQTHEPLANVVVGR